MAADKTTKAKRLRQYAPGTLDIAKLPPRLGRRECAYIMGVSPGSWDAYWDQHADLRRASRVFRLDPNSRGKRQWLKKAVLHHAEWSGK